MQRWEIAAVYPRHFPGLLFAEFIARLLIQFAVADFPKCDPDHFSRGYSSFYERTGGRIFEKLISPYDDG